MTISEAQIKQKMAQSVARKSQGSALIPPGVSPTSVQAQAQAQLDAKTDAETIPTIEELIPDTEVDRTTTIQTLWSLAKQYKLESQMESRAKKEKDSYSKRIKFLLGSYGIAKAICGQFKVSVTPVRRTSIDPLKLLAHGVSEETILACTDVTETPTINVREINDRD